MKIRKLNMEISKLKLLQRNLQYIEVKTTKMIMKIKCLRILKYF